jgi:hypothetical protein
MKSEAGLIPGTYFVVQVIAPSRNVGSILGGSSDDFYSPFESAIGVSHVPNSHVADGFAIDSLTGAVKRHEWGFEFFFAVAPNLVSVIPAIDPGQLSTFLGTWGRM